MTTISTDSRGRTTLAAKNATFRVTNLEGGSVLLEPVEVLTKAEIALLASPGLLDQVRRNSAPDAPSKPRVGRRRQLAR